MQLAPCDLDWKYLDDRRHLHDVALPVLWARTLYVKIQDSDKYSKSNSRAKVFETIFFEAEWRGKLFQMKIFCAAKDSAKCSSKLELSS